MKAGRVHHVYNFGGLQRTDVSSPAALPQGRHTVLYEFAYDGGAPGSGGTSRLSVDGKKVGEARVARTMPYVYSGDEGVDVGMDSETPVTEERRRPKSSPADPQGTVDVKSRLRAELLARAPRRRALTWLAPHIPRRPVSRTGLKPVHGADQSPPDTRRRVRNAAHRRRWPPSSRAARGGEQGGGADLSVTTSRGSSSCATASSVIDPGSAFLELSPLAAYGLLRRRGPCAGLVPASAWCAPHRDGGGERRHREGRTYYPSGEEARARQEWRSRTACRASTGGFGRAFLRSGRCSDATTGASSTTRHACPRSASRSWRW